MRTSTTSMPKACRLAVDADRGCGAIRLARSSRTTWVKVASPSTRRSAELSSVEQPRVGALDRADRLVEAQRIDDAVAREGVDHEPLLVGGDDFLRRRFEIEDALVDQ